MLVTEPVAQRSSLQALLALDHERLEAIYVRLLAALRADAWDEATRLWNEFEGVLSRHMDLEERLILPALADVEPREVEALLEQHAQFRRKLTELGVTVDLHATRLEVVEDFLSALQQHAAREDALAYRWTEANFSSEAKNEIKDWLLASGSRRKRSR